MKLPLIYGSLMAVIGALVTYGLFFAGFHDSPEKIQSAQWVGTVVGIVAGVTCLALAMRDHRAQYPLDRTWSYGSAVGVGVLTALWGAILGCVFGYIYFAIINPQFSDTLLQAQVAKLEAKGLSSAQIDAASGMMKKFMSPPVMTAMQLITGFIWGTILSLLIAIFFRRRDVPVQAPLNAEPPPVA